MKNYVLCLGALLALTGATYYITTRQMHQHVSPQRCSLRTNMRKLWADHVWWTRNYLIAALANLPELKATTDRLLKNQDDIGAALVPYYGKEAGDKLSTLLREHILIAADVVKAAQAKKSDKLTDAQTKWHTNADEIALFLSKANPHLPYEDLKKMLYSHLELTTNEAIARIKKEWVTDIETFDKVFNEILVMSDALTKAIAKQFPDKF
jgi:hypothetical protein